MTKKDAAKLAMYQTVLKLCNENEAIADTVEALKEAVSELESKVKKIETKAHIGGENVKGFAAAKKKLKIKVSELGAKVAGAMFAMACAKKDLKMKPQADFSVTDLRRMRQRDLDGTASNILELAIEHKTALAAYNITKETLETLGDAIKAYRDAMPGPRVAHIQKNGANKSITSLVKATDLFLKDQMDKAAAMLKEDEPDFYKDYRAARKIVQPGVKHTSVAGSFVNKADGEPVFNAFVEIEGLGRVVYSDLNGLFDSGKIKRGTYDIRVGAQGFVSQVFRHVPVKYGKVTRLEIELVAEVAEMGAVA